MSHKLKITLLLGLFLTPIFPAQAAWYQVEVVIFEYIHPDLDDEIWFENPGLPSREDTIELVDALPEPVVPKEPAQATPEAKIDPQIVDEAVPVPPGDVADPQVVEEKRIPYLALPQSSFRLQEVWRVLRASREYRPLLHVAWQQEGHEQDLGRAVHLEKLEGPASFQSNAYQPAATVLDGTVRIRASRFLHVDLDIAYMPGDLQQLLLSQQQSLGTGNDPQVNPYAEYVRLIENRRIKLDELQYFDHPLFGVILQVSRLRDSSSLPALDADSD